MDNKEHKNNDIEIAPQQIAGEKYRLSGFTIQQRGELVQVFANFCNIDEDPDNLAKTKYSAFFKDEAAIIRPSLSTKTIFEYIAGNEDEPIYSPRPRLSLANMKGVPVLDDLNKVQIYALLQLMRAAREEYIKDIKKTPVVAEISLRQFESKEPAAYLNLQRPAPGI